MIENMLTLLQAKLAELSAKKAYDDAVAEAAKAEKAWIAAACDDEAPAATDFIRALQLEGFNRMAYVQARSFTSAVMASIKGEATPGCNCARCLRVRGHAA